MRAGGPLPPLPTREYFRYHRGREIDWVLVGTVAMVVFFAGVVLAGVRNLHIASECLERGWANSRMTWKLEGYCVREENEYEITRPLSEL